MLPQLVLIYFTFEAAILTISDAIDCISQTIELVGAGSSFPSAMYQELGAMYSANRSLDLTINFFFDKVNSIYGKDRIKMTNSSLPPIVFAGSEVVLSPYEKAKYPELLTFPAVAGALAIVFNIPKVDQINLTSTCIADIFLGTIEYWNDMSIQSINPAIQLPHKKILLVARSDSGAGDTFIFTSALSKISRIWAQSYGTFFDPEFVAGECCNSTKWPSDISFYGNRVTGLIGIVGSIPYTLGYAAWPNTIGTGVTYAKIINDYGTLVEPNVGTVRSSMNYFLENASKDISDGLQYDINGAKSQNGYPFASFSYIIVNRTTHPNISICQMQELVGFVMYLFNPTMSPTISKYGLVPLSSNVTDFIIRTIITQITSQNVAIYKEFLKSLIHPLFLSTDTSRNLIITGCAFALVTMLAIGSFGTYYRRNKRKNETLWMLNDVTITIDDQHQQSTLSCSSDFNLNSSKVSLLKGQWSRNQSKVFLTEVSMESKRGLNLNLNKKQRVALNKFTKEIQHSNLLSFLGVTVVDSRIFFVTQHWMIKGTLHHVLQTCPFHIGESIKANIARDILEGLIYLHGRNIVHGTLNSLECLVDVVWSVKIAHWELNSLKVVEKFSPAKELLSKISGTDDIVFESEEDLVKLLYLYPDYFDDQNRYTYHSDIYSFGVLLVEIFTRKIPYSQDAELALVTYTDIIKDKFKIKYFSPPMSISDVPLSIQNLVNKTLTVPDKQIDSNTLLKCMKNIAGDKGSVIDILMQSMEHYMNQLEDKVNERTSELTNLTSRMRDLLNDVLPKQIAIKLFNGQPVEPEFYECCTIFFSDIVGFTTISARSTPTQVMSFLNSLYTLFDKTVAKFDVYKVDTIGDAYMAASGLPVRNGIEHIKQIGLMSLALLSAGHEFKIPHLPKEDLKIRMGINSGPVTTGIIGNKMPQYCVFGDTVNTASRMESTSLPHKIQMTEFCKNLLIEYYPQFSLQLRGEIEIKGKGFMNTYWLLSYEQGLKQM